MTSYKGDETTGFQSPAQDHIEDVLDLAVTLDLRRPSRFPVRVKGQGLLARGIQDGDILVTDAASEPKAGRVCVAMVGGDVILATLACRGEEWLLTPAAGPAIAVGEDVEIWAIVEALVRTTI